MKNLIKLLLFTLFTVCLSSTAFAKVYDFTYYNQLSLIEDPHESVDIKIDLIKNAKHHVHIITYFWDNSEVPRRVAEELNKANERGVEVRIVTSFLPTFGTDPLGKGKGVLKHKNPTASLDYPNTFLSPVEDPNSAVFTYFSLTPGTKFSLTNSFHEKIFLVDGEVAIIGGRNISDSSLSGKDLEVMMRGAVVNQVQDHFYRMYYFILYSKMEANCSRNNTIYVECSNVFLRSHFNTAYKTYSG